MYYRLVPLNPLVDEQRTSWQLHLPATIGRSPEHDVSINHESISRTHCRLTLSVDGALMVRDLNSTNGTYVDDNRVDRSVLKPGDILQLGAVSFRIDYMTESSDDSSVDNEPPTYDLSATARMRSLTPESATPSVAVDPAKKWWQIWKS